MKIAIIYDRVNKIGGAERILLAMHEIWPDAPLYTAVYDKKNASWADVFLIKTSFLQKILFAKNHHELLPILTPFAFEAFNFDNFDIVISVTSAEAKCIITKPKTFHICYCLTPPRYLWSEVNNYYVNTHSGLLSPIIKKVYKNNLKMLKKWDKISSNRPDYYLSISKEVDKRIKKYYQKNSTVIYPPVDTENFVVGNDKDLGKYFLIVSRLVSYKRIDIAVKAFNLNKLPLKIIGNGTEKKYLKKIAGKNIEFIDKRLTETELISYYQGCKALIFPGKEDFGLVMVEANACGKPVIAYKDGGALEIVNNSICGEFFYPQNEKALLDAVNDFDESKYKKDDCRNNALKFDKQIFCKNIKILIENKYKEYIKNL